MPNNIDTDLKNQLLLDSSILGLTPILGFQGFTMDYSDDMIPSDVGSIKVPIAYDAGTVETGSGFVDFETSDTTLSACSVDMTTYSRSFAISPGDMSNGRKLAHLYEVNLMTVAFQLQKAVSALFTTSNFTAGYNSTASAFDAAALRTVWGAIQHPIKNALLETALVAKFLPADMNAFDPTKAKVGVLGFNRFQEYTFTGAGTNVKGFVGAPSSLVTVSRIPVVEDNGEVEKQIIKLDGLPPILYREWFSTKYQSRFGNFSVVFGAAKADTAKGRVIVAS